MTDLLLSSPPRPDERVPLGIALAVGVTALVPVLLLDGLVPGTAHRLLLPALAVLVFGLLTADVVASAAFLVVTALLVDGFLLGGGGTLSWDGVPDLGRLGVLLAAAAVGTTLGAAVRAVRRPVRVGER